MTTAITLDRDEWLRRHVSPDYLSASQFAAALGEDRFCSPYALFQRKKGAVPWPESNRRMRLGKHTEPLIAEFYTEETGEEIYNPGEFAIHEHPDHPQIFCTVDYLKRSNDAPVELKTFGMYIAKDWADGAPPLANQIQLQGCISILGHTTGALAGFAVGTEKFYTYQVARHEMADKMIPALLEFLDRLANDDAPEPDGSESTGEALKWMYPGVYNDETTHELSDEFIHLLDQYVLSGETAKHCEAQRDEIKARLTAEVGNASIATYGGKPVFTLRPQIRRGGVTIDPSWDGRMAALGIPFERKPDTQSRVLRIKK